MSNVSAIVLSSGCNENPKAIDMIIMAYLSVAMANKIVSKNGIINE
jgi:hypothetical protein